jgi:hypothetical protein
MIDFSNDSLFNSPSPPTAAEVSAATAALLPQVFDPKDVIAQFSRHEAHIAAMGKAARDLAVVSDDTNATATAIGSNAAAATKELEFIRDRVLRPHVEYVSAIRGCCKKYVDMIKAEIIDPLKLKQKNYLQEQRVEAERKRQAYIAEQKRRREELEAKIRKIEALSGQKIEIPPLPDIAPPPVATPGPVRTARGTSFARKVLVVEIEDVKLIPREYLVPNMTLIRAACKDGKKIPGVRSYEDDNISYRTA